MRITSQTGGESRWKAPEKIAFRILFVYLLLQVLPLDWKFYSYLGTVDWSGLAYQDIFNLARYTTRFTAGPAGFSDWGILFGIAVVAGLLWTYRDAGRTDNYHQLYYWLRVLVRYRLALAILAYGFIKFFPMQAPYPSLSSLNTPYGAFNRWKLFSLSLGIVPSYELFLGLVEIVIGLLLLNRKTASIAAFIFLVFCGNIFMSNLAYEGGDTVYSLYLITLALFVFSFDLLRVVQLLILQLPTAPNVFRPAFADRWKMLRVVLKSAFVLFFVVIYGIKTGIGARKNPYQYPTAKGLPAAAGLYNVSTYVLNNDTVAYTPSHPKRWQNVVFEEWNTLSIRSGEPVVVDSNNAHLVPKADADKRYESEGTNGRHYYSYVIDSVHQQLLLSNRNPHYQHDVFVLQYSRPAADRVVLAGITAARDSVYMVLDKLPKKYLLEEAAKGDGRLRKLRL